MTLVPNWNLKALIRQKHGLQLLFADRVHLTEMRLSKIVCGRRQPTPDERRRIAEALGVEEAEVFPTQEEVVTAGSTA